MCPDAYEHTNRDDLPKPTRTSLLAVCLCFGVALVVVSGGYMLMFKDSSDQLYKIVREIADAPARTARTK